MPSRNRNSLSLKEKMCILKRVDENEHLKRIRIAKELGLPVSTLNTLICKTVSGESGDVDCETVDDWIQNQLPVLIKGYEQKDFFNADETGLFYNLPSKILAIKSDTCHGGKKSKVRLTVLLCANADGSEKLPPLIIGKSKKPCYFKNVKTLPTKYLSNKKSWMTMSFFTDCLKGLDDKMRKQKRRIILFIDQYPAHPPDTDFLKNITVKFFPANCTSK
ncbi:Tigger transposable element-derived protein 4 [Araneus ventricosus]|uniref:Tigger transposable element-derived protein 4 n=1 Tax=Araneus ventricosus TaxID=182803 RepID=A0A4Y2X3D9_ARAVE|nr:Tigger transposable element-derived protein 4 [Araneus ventricosus]